MVRGGAAVGRTDELRDRAHHGHEAIRGEPGRCCQLSISHHDAPQIQLDLVVNTGDLSLNDAENASDLIAARRMHEEIGLPWAAVPGDHDIGDNFEVARGPRFDAARRKQWLDMLGGDYWMRDVPGWRLLGINALSLGSDIREAGAQIRFIFEAARTLGARRLALFMHNPLYLDYPHETRFTADSTTPVVRRLLLDSLGPVVPTLICSGHLRSHRELCHGQLRHVSAPPICCPPDERPDRAIA